LVHECFRASVPFTVRVFVLLSSPPPLSPLRLLQGLHYSLRSARHGGQLICNGTYWRHDITRGDNCWIRDTY